MLYKIIYSLTLCLLFTATVQAQTLCQAVSISDTTLAISLLNAGANPNQTDTTGKTPLFIATLNGDLQMATLLLDNGADVNLADSTLSTPLMKAADLGFIDLVDLYVVRQADLHLIDIRQMNALDHAAESNAVAGSGSTSPVDPEAVYTRLHLEMNP
jgi:ankyrin repeat protein